MYKVARRTQAAKVFSMMVRFKGISKPRRVPYSYIEMYRCATGRRTRAQNTKLVSIWCCANHRADTTIKQRQTNALCIYCIYLMARQTEIVLPVCAVAGLDCTIQHTHAYISFSIKQIFAL